MNIEQIENELHVLVRRERQTTLEILHLILKAEELRIPERRAFKSTADWLIQTFKYSESAAYRRITSARLLKTTPTIETKIADGTVNLTTLAMAQSAIRCEEKRSGDVINRNQVIEKIANLTAAKTEQVLAKEFPELKPRRDSIRAINATDSRLNVVIDSETRELLARAKSKLSHAVPDGSANSILKRALTVLLKQCDTAKPKAKREILKRSGEQCEWIGTNGQRCDSRHQLEVDHRLPRAKGGSSDLGNLRTLCKKHNLFAAEQSFGKRKMQEFRQI